MQEVPRGDYKDIMDVYFSHVGQCDPGDCDAQKEFFTIKGHAEQHDAWSYKYLLDLDGNAFSGRFYAFLKSKSLVYKFAVFREWHAEWLKPWAHYIPLSLEGDEWLEAVRFFDSSALGKKEAERLALQGRDWANRVLRNEDLEVWFFRLLLEYVFLTCYLTISPLFFYSRFLVIRPFTVAYCESNNYDRYGRVIDDDRERIGFSA